MNKSIRCERGSYKAFVADRLSSAGRFLMAAMRGRYSFSAASGVTDAEIHRYVLPAAIGRYGLHGAFGITDPEVISRNRTIFCVRGSYHVNGAAAVTDPSGKSITCLRGSYAIHVAVGVTDPVVKPNRTFKPLTVQRRLIGRFPRAVRTTHKPHGR